MATKYIRGGCQCCCSNGGIVSKWFNQTAVRQIDDTLPPTYTQSRYSRHNPSDISNACDAGDCPDARKGYCGNWIYGGGANGDFHGVSEQVIDDTVNDILTCAADDDTHTANDHNCYVGTEVAATALVAGTPYVILDAGTSDFKKAGSPDNSKGTGFIATGSTTGTGKALLGTDMRTNIRKGGQWVLAKKNWHGTFGFVDRCDPNRITGIIFDAGAVSDGHVGFNGTTTVFQENPPQTKYRSLTIGAMNTDPMVECNYTSVDTYHVLMGQDPDVSTMGFSDDVVCEQPRSVSVNRYSGVISLSGTDSTEFFSLIDSSPIYMAEGQFIKSSWSLNDAITYFAAWSSFNSPNIGGGWSYTHSGNEYSLYDGSNVLREKITIDISARTFERLVYGQDIFSVGGGPPSEHIGLVRTESCSVTDTELTFYSKTQVYGNWDDTEPIPNPAGDLSFLAYSIKFTLSDPYTAENCYADFNAALRAWDMSDMNLAKFRTDEKLALAPLCIYDEVTPTTPILGDYAIIMPDLRNGSAEKTAGSFVVGKDYVITSLGDWENNNGTDFTLIGASHNGLNVRFTATGAGSGTGTASQIMPWRDPKNFIWQYNDSGNWTYNAPVTWAEARIIGGGETVTGYPKNLRTGSIISHTQAGSQRHFWFNYHKLRRVTNKDALNNCAEDGSYAWLPDTIGGSSAIELPAGTMRWMDNLEAQYDAKLHVNGGGAPPAGNYPQAWLRQHQGTIVGGKYCEAVLQWPSVNYGLPTGWMKYAVDQTTVCCVTASGANSFTVKPTGNAIDPLATGGLQDNDYILVEGDGIYKITSIAAGVGEWTIGTGSKIDDLPSGINCLPLPLHGLGIYSDGQTHLGRLRFPEVSGISGRVAVTPNVAGTQLTTAVSCPYLRVNPTNNKIYIDIYDSDMALLVGNAELSRVDDTTFNIVGITAPTAAYIVGVDLNWEDFEETPKRTGVHLAWTFDQRAVHKPSPPSFYGGISGCMSCAVSEFTYEKGKCPAVVGIVPYYSDVVNPAAIPNPNARPTVKPLENFNNQNLFQMPDVFKFDDLYGAHWQAAVEMTMVDPFWQAPYKPSCGELEIECDVIDWDEDNGCGTDDYLETVNAVAHCHKIYPHQRWVEAKSTVPVGKTLDSRVELFYDPNNIFAPPYYIYADKPSGGIPLADLDAEGDGEYSSIERPWGLQLRVTRNTCTDPNRFLTYYNEFVP